MIEDLSATLMSLTKRSTRSNPWSVFQIVTDMRNQFISFICPAPFSQTLTFTIIPKKKWSTKLPASLSGIAASAQSFPCITTFNLDGISFSSRPTNQPTNPNETIPRVEGKSAPSTLVVPPYPPSHQRGVESNPQWREPWRFQLPEIYPVAKKMGCFLDNLN